MATQSTAVVRIIRNVIRDDLKRTGPGGKQWIKMMPKDTGALRRSYAARTPNARTVALIFKPPAGEYWRYTFTAGKPTSQALRRFASQRLQRLAPIVSRYIAEHVAEELRDQFRGIAFGQLTRKRGRRGGFRVDFRIDV